MKLKLFAVLLVLFSVTSLQAKTKTPKLTSVKKHALARVILAPVEHPVSFMKKVGGVVLFAIEIPVDGAHATFYAADKTFDFLSLQGKFPVLDVIYGAISIANIDTGKLDKGIESLEDKAYGHHN